MGVLPGGALARRIVLASYLVRGASTTTANSTGTGVASPGLPVVGQPAVHLADTVLEQRQVPVVVQQPRLRARHVRGEPLAVAQRDELVLPAVHHQYWN